MDIPSSRFQRALTEKIKQARIEKTENLAMSVRMATTLDQVKFEAGILQGFTEVMQWMDEIEAKLIAEAR